MRHNKAGSVMTTDVVHAGYGTPFKEVARLLSDHRISGLPVLDDDKVVGVVSETGLTARQAAVPDLHGGGRRTPPAQLTGHTECRAETEIAVAMTRRIDGVVDVVDKLTYRLDDARVREEQALRGAADDRLRGL
ncbi:CBS domain-containing protein [Streptomyces sp900105755]|uniref:CBS domain-containing protein n=1 Tax=Streptomyces sp. 900105755 TaxID=3154389 RepID=UPI003324780B